MTPDRTPDRALHDEIVDRTPTRAADIADDRDSLMDHGTTDERAIDVSPAYDRVRERAYFLYLERGGRDGGHEDDWHRAERELREPRDESPDMRQDGLSA